MICDLSNVEGQLGRCTSAVIDSVHSTMSEIVDDFLGTENSSSMGRIIGDGLNTEIAIYGPTKDGLECAKKTVYGRLGAQMNLDLHAIHDSFEARGISKTASLVSVDETVLRAYADLCRFYSQFVQFGAHDDAQIFRQRQIYSNHRVWKEIAGLATNKLFILSAGLPIALGYMNSTLDERVFYTEIHRQNDAGVLDKLRDFEGVYPDPVPFKKESWIVIDKAYTGGSIDHAKRHLRSILGKEAQISSLALFPKSFKAFASADYAVYAGRLIEVKKIISELDPENWHRQLLYMEA